MSAPRMTFAGTTYSITRTTMGRMFLLKPDPVVNQVFLYCLFFAAQKYGVLVHCVSVESNHFHAVVTDVRGEISGFMHWLDTFVARNLIEHYAQTHPGEHVDAIWSKGHFSAVVLATPNAVKDAIAYDLTNPVKDGLVRDYREWPGLNSRPGDWTKPKRRVRRPEGLYFSDRDAEFRWVDVTYTVPPMLADERTEIVVDSINTLIRERMKTAWHETARKGRSVLGVKAVVAVDPFDSPNTPRLNGTRDPQFAAGGDTAMLKAGLKLLRTFRQTYRECWIQLRNGGRDVVFPAGTYLLRVRFGVACDTLHPPWCVVGRA